MEKPREDENRLLSPEEFDDGTELDNFEPHSSSRRYATPQTSSSLLNLSPKVIKNAVIGIAVALCLVLVASMLPGRNATPTSTGTTINVVGSSTPSVKDTDLSKFEKPAGVKVVGIIFYGRARFVDILDCYLQKNLVINGGLIDEVRFMQNTDNQEDLAYLDKLVEKVPQYIKVPVKRDGDKHGWGGFNIMWSHLTEDDTIYLKIDDDIVWIHEDAVPRMISSLINHPEAHDIAGNIINSPVTDWLHYHNDAVHPFLPELEPPANQEEVTDWRSSKLPSYSGPIADSYDWEPQETKPDGPYKVGQIGGPPFEGHRWLPLEANSEQLQKTPIEKSSYDPFGMGWRSWAMGAQQHYSLFRNIENGWLSRYWFGNGEGLWNMQYGRYNLNFLAIWGSSVRMELPGTDDEQDLTVTIPKKFHRPCLVDTHALIAHFNFGTQPEIGHTDLLDRYRLLANEKVCTSTNQKSRLP